MLKSISQTLVYLLCFTQIATSFAASPADKALSADEIMKMVDDRDIGDTQIAESLLTLIDSKDRRRHRELKSFRVKSPEVEKSIIFFQSPSDIKGTSYLTYEWEATDKEDDSWLYIPTLQQVKRVAATDESGSFMGSDFSFADINGLEYGDFIYSLISASESISGHDCWAIKLTPANDDVIKKTGYTSAQSWIRKDNFLVIQSKIELKSGNRTKFFTAGNIEQIDDIWTAKTLQMITTKAGKVEHSSLLEFRKVAYNTDVDANLFDTQAMQRGL